MLLLGVVFFITRFTEVQKIALTLQAGEFSFILLALLTGGLWIVCTGLGYRAVYHVLGMDEERGHMIVLGAAVIFVNVITPSAGASAIATLIGDARRHDRPAARVMVAWALNLLFEYLSLLCVVTLGLAVLARRNTINWGEITASMILLLAALGLGTLLYLGMKSGDLLGRVLAWLARLINHLLRPIIHRDYLEEHRAHTFAYEAAEGIATLRHRPKDLWLPVTLALSNKALLMLTLALLFLAFQVPFSTGTIIAGFSLAYLFVIVSPTPAGVGIVEGVMTLMLNSLNVPLEAAAVITLAFRGITFWLPLLVGMVCFRILSTRNRVTLKNAGDN